MSTIPSEGSLSLAQIRNSFGLTSTPVSLVSYARGSSSSPLTVTGLNGIGGSIPHTGGRGYLIGSLGTTGLDLVVNTNVQGFEYTRETAFSLQDSINVNDLAGGSGVSSQTAGFVAGNDSTSTIQKFLFATEVGSVSSAQLSVAREYSAGFMSSSRGYWSGGLLELRLNATTEIDGIIFASETAVNPSAALGTKRQSAVGNNSSTRGYTMGGYFAEPKGPTTQYNTIDRFEFSTEANSVISAVLAVARGTAAGLSSTARGYVLGGGTEIDGIVFATEAAINPSAALSVSVGNNRGLDSGGANGYSLGGFNSQGGYQAGVDRFVYASESLTRLSVGLMTSISGGAAVSNRIYNQTPTISLSNFRGFTPHTGYWSGGNTAGGTVNAVDGIVFATEAATNTSATFPLLARARGAGASGQANGYSVGGFTTDSAWFKGVDRFAFASETYSSAAIQLSQARENLASVSNYYVALFSGGDNYRTEIDGFYVYNETAINPSSTLTTDMTGHVGVTGRDTGYFAMGSTINSIDLIFWTVLTTSMGLPRFIQGAGRATDRSIRGYIVGGSAPSVPPLRSVYTIEYATETLVTRATSLSTGKFGLTGVNSHVQAYFGGGQVSFVSGDVTNAIDGIRFSDITASTLSATLASGARSNTIGFQSGYI